MALIKCEDCFNDISDVALACPHCGRPTPRSAQEETARRVSLDDERRRRRNRNGNALGCLVIVLTIIVGLTIGPFAAFITFVGGLLLGLIVTHAG
ncbi:MAG: hypothetical protein HOQ12_01825 [Gemmatimonadaceae bacterium]|nr:hypothetical protein [Gemmatimonadaceae bacterium]NUQ94986.1 hypothetical protein [Gemmatimonadaceae bacterium]NUR18251.1 hypothetical protein [Gemmatimonadaceae bacterium]